MSLLAVCAEPTCANLVTSGRCPVHSRSKWPASNGSQAYRGEWPRIRAQVLKEEPVCRLRLPGCLIASTDVDHIVPLSRGGTHARSNLRGLCGWCHRHVTATMRKR
jgi:5-methylcytosine-specific restriction protein A